MLDAIKYPDVISISSAKSSFLLRGRVFDRGRLLANVALSSGSFFGQGPLFDNVGLFGHIRCIIVHPVCNPVMVLKVFEHYVTDVVSRESRMSLE